MPRVRTDVVFPPSWKSHVHLVDPLSAINFICFRNFSRSSHLFDGVKIENYDFKINVSYNMYYQYL